MPLIKEELKTQIAFTTKEAAHKACLKMLEKMQEISISQSAGDITTVQALKKQEIALAYAVEFTENFASKMANHIHNYIKSATVIAPPGVAVSTAGTAAAQTGATTAPVKSKIL